jgi:hypothetical protein
MKRVPVIIVLGNSLVGLIPGTAQADAATDGELGAFAVFNQLGANAYWQRGYWGGPIIVGRPCSYYASFDAPYAAPPIAYTVPPATREAPSAPLVQREVVFAHRRYMLYGDGVRQAYQQVRIPNPPPPAPAPSPPEKP